MSSSVNRRVLLKLSGEALHSQDSRTTIDAGFVSVIAEQIKEVISNGVELAIVVGGGNIFRGTIAQSLGMDRVKGDYMGMMATVINALALESGLLHAGVPAIAMSAVAGGSVISPFRQAQAVHSIKDGKVVVLAGGTGNPYFTTDTAAALRALELGCNELLKATKVDGVYSADPVENPDAVFFDKLSFEEVMSRKLRVMDQTAFSLCRDNGLPIRIFNLTAENSIVKALGGETIGTLVS